MRNPEYQFADTSVESLVSLLVQGYEELAGETVQPGSPEQLFIRWVASILVHERVLMNVIGNQNIPSRAEGVFAAVKNFLPKGKDEDVRFTFEFDDEF